jgi:hypothetical protein
MHFCRMLETGANSRSVLESAIHSRLCRDSSRSSLDRRSSSRSNSSSCPAVGPIWDRSELAYFNDEHFFLWYRAHLGNHRRFHFPGTGTRLQCGRSSKNRSKAHRKGASAASGRIRPERFSAKFNGLSLGAWVFVVVLLTLALLIFYKALVLYTMRIKLQASSCCITCLSHFFVASAGSIPNRQ